MMSWHIRISAACCAVGLLMAVAASPAAQRQPSANDAPSAAVNLTLQTADAGYVGEERCISCHKPEATEFHKTPHAKLKDTRSAQAMNCESCHGAGKTHADAEEAAHGDDQKTAAANLLIFSFHGAAQANAARCLTCHASARGQQAFEHSQHAGAGKTAKGKKVKVVRQTIGTLTADQMIAIVTNGKGDDMNGFAKDFSADQITQLVAYYRGLAKE
jgi:mono/diheme cytochrome c family protein